MARISSVSLPIEDRSGSRAELLEILGMKSKKKSPLKPKKSIKKKPKTYKRDIICGNCLKVKHTVIVPFGKTWLNYYGEYDPVCKFCGCY